MIRTLRVLWLSALGAAFAAAQMPPTVDIYTTPSSDGTNVYATGVMQVSSSSPNACGAQGQCPTIIHTYKQTVTITSPSGRTGSCSFNFQQPSTSPFNGQCEAALAISGETGDFTVQDNQIAICALVGEFLNGVINFPIGISLTATNYKQSFASKSSCVYSVDCDATPTCGAAQGYANVTASPPCKQYYLQQFVSAIYEYGRVCYAVPYIPPNFFSGAQDARAPCN